MHATEVPSSLPLYTVFHYLPEFKVILSTGIWGISFAVVSGAATSAPASLCTSPGACTKNCVQDRASQSWQPQKMTFCIQHIGKIKVTCYHGHQPSRAELPTLPQEWRRSISWYMCNLVMARGLGSWSCWFTGYWNLQLCYTIPNCLPKCFAEPRAPLHLIQFVALHKHM